MSGCALGRSVCTRRVPWRPRQISVHYRKNPRDNSPGIVFRALDFGVFCG